MNDRSAVLVEGTSLARPRRFPWWGWIGLALAAYLGVSCLGLSLFSRRPYTCALCRTDRVDRSYLGFTISELTESDCTRWYAEHIEPSHVHSWAPGTFCRRFGIPFIQGGYGCSIGAPITMLSQSVQMKIYERFDDRSEAKQLFISVGQKSAESSLKWRVLMDWVEADYPGSWRDWWETHRNDD